MAQIIRYVIEDTGRLYRQTITEQEIEMQSDIMARFAKEQTVRVRGVMSAQALSPKLVDSINLAVCGNVVAFTVRLGLFPLKARFTVSDKGIVPDFTSASTPMTLEWRPPPDMYIYMLIIMLPGQTCSQEQYIVARDASGRTFRMPTTNMHDNCQLCTGKYDGLGVTYADAIGKALNQFVNSDWGSHLPGTKEQMNNSKKLFRFKPLEPEGFEQLGIADGKHWTEVCTKVSAEVITKYLTP